VTGTAGGPDASTEGIRLQKVLAQAGIGSRRACEELIAAGRVQIDGKVVREQGVRVDPATVVLHVDGVRVQLDPEKLTIALHKPRGVVSSMHDEHGRPDLSSVVSDRRLFHVGRLDQESEGLLLLTNDGELAHRLAHPSHEVTKTYIVTVEGRVAPGVGKRLKAGIELEDGPVTVDAYHVLEMGPERSLVEVSLHSGRNRVVRRMFEALGHPVTRLVRTRVGPVRLGHLAPGQTRVVDGNELGRLMSEVGL
jgi:23S rRNA pseudouridine2605 synthase